LEVGVLWRKGNYSIEEVTALVEGVEELTTWETKGWILVRLIDMWRAFAWLDQRHQEAVLLVGMQGLSTRAAASLTDMSHTTMANRYTQGLKTMVNYLNGGKSSLR
jgi:DNA-directed RNA polymerase specialized sigma24 family protein